MLAIGECDVREDIKGNTSGHNMGAAWLTGDRNSQPLLTEPEDRAPPSIFRNGLLNRQAAAFAGSGRLRS